MRLLRAILLLLIVVTAFGGVPAAQNPALPPLSWSCPMHPDIVQDANGTCPICRMDLTPVRLDSIFSCPVHSVVMEPRSGKCPICRRDLVPVTVAVSWTCADRPDVEHLEPGTCADGSARVVGYKARAHGNHNPQHGGLFFMAGDNWHHLEGTYPEQGLFRLYLYDDYSRPLRPEQIAQAKGRIVTDETFDPATRRANEISVFPLAPGAGGGYLEARIDPLPPPARMIAKIAFDAQGQEYRFDFAFPTFTREATVDAAAAAASGIDPSQIAVEVPNTPDEVLTALETRKRQIGAILARSAFAELYVPALQAKDLALALDAHARVLPGDRRAQVTEAIKQVVLSAWRLDTFGDQGDREQIAAAYKTFSAAVDSLGSVFHPR